MALIQFISSSNQLIIHSHFYFYGDAANEQLSLQIASDIQQHWNEPEALIRYRHEWLDVRFEIRGFYEPNLQPETVWYNTDPKVFYFRIDEYSPQDISFVDGLGCNTGLFKLGNLLQTSTTAAHEYGHMLGLEHPHDLDIRRKGMPGIMYPRGTICDPQYQYNPQALPGTNGGTLDPQHRKVLLSDVEQLKLHKLDFVNGFAVLGGFTSIYHSRYQPGN